jgi:hypothetical protein
LAGSFVCPSGSNVDGDRRSRAIHAVNPLGGIDHRTLRPGLAGRLARERSADARQAQPRVLEVDQSNTKGDACPPVPREEHRGTMVSVRTFGQPHPFIERPWSEFDAFLAPIAAEHPEFSYLVEIVRSVLASDAQDELAGTTSMHDILVVPRPIPDPPYEVIAVRAPGSLRAPPPGCVRIEHMAVTNRNDSIDHPTEDAVTLFWRFVFEKYGIRSTKD